MFLFKLYKSVNLIFFSLERLSSLLDAKKVFSSLKANGGSTKILVNPCGATPELTVKSLLLVILLI